MSRFFIFALPRSRSAWLSTLLTHQSVMCLHEALLGCTCPEEIEAKLAACDMPIAGCADTGISLLVDELIELYPAARFVVLLRDLGKFKKQMLKLGMDPVQVTDMLDSFNYAAEQLQLQGPQTLFVKSDELDDYGTCQMIWEHIGMATPLHPLRFEQLRDMKIEVYMDRLQAKVVEHADQIRQLLLVDEE